MTIDIHDPSFERGDRPPALLTLSRVFNEGVMGLLALVALGISLGQMVFEVGAETERVLDLVEWLLVAIFATEFCVNGATAANRRAWLRSPWRIVDAVTILGPAIALLPGVSDRASGSLMLRALRLGRAVAFGTRAGSVAAGKRRSVDHVAPATAPEVSLIRSGGDLTAVPSDWETFLVWTKQPGDAWFHASKVHRDHFYAFARATGAWDRNLDDVVAGDGHAKLRETPHHVTLVLQIPTVAEHGFPAVHRHRLLAVITERGLATALSGPLDLQKSVMRLWTAVPDLPFPVKVVCALLSLVRARNQVAAQRFDDEERRLEVLEGGHVFLQRTFRLRREISTTALDLWHIKSIVGALAEGKAKLAGVDLKDDKYLDDLQAETESLYETVTKNKEDLDSLIDLHINYKSFEMNKFLKLLAVVSFLGLIPSVAGGLLGMNVLGEPWPVTLGQVAFGVAMAMATALYVFAVKGWLR